MKQEAENNPLVSVIIPTKNSSNTLVRCLESIRRQTYSSIEIIVVDNYSTDNTKDIALRFTNKVFIMSPERSSQVNHGVAMASGEYVYRVDSDFVLEPDVVSESVMLAESNKLAAVLIHNSSDPSISYWSKVRKFERDMYDDSDLNVAVRFVRRDAFLSVGGMDPRLNYGEDYDFHNRIVKEYKIDKIGKIRSRELHVGEYRNIKEIASRNYYYGKSAGLFLKKNKIKGISQAAPFKKIYLRNFKQFINHPNLTAGFVIYQIVRYSSGLLGLLSCLIHRSHL